MIDSTCAESSWWRRAASVVVVLVLLGAAVVALPGAARPAAAVDCHRTGAHGEVVAIPCATSTPGSTSTPTTAPKPKVPPAPSGPRYRYRYVLACDGNTLQTPGTTTCELAISHCAAPRLFYWEFRSGDGVRFEQVGSRCMTPGEVTEGEAVPGLTLEDFRVLPIPGQAVVLEPGNGYALVGVPLNAVAGTAPQVLQTTVLGASVVVTATPVAWTWDFGDGTVLGPLSDPGAPYPALGTSHVYAAGGDVVVTLTTTYAGQYSVDGGPLAAVAGTAQVASPPVPLAVLVGGGALVGDPVG